MNTLEVKVIKFYWGIVCCFFDSIFVLDVFKTIYII